MVMLLRTRFPFFAEINLRLFEFGHRLGEGQIIMAGVERKVKMFCMRSKYSGKIFAPAYAVERQEMFFDGHMRAFEHFGGVFREHIYDNLTTAVKRVLRGRKRIEQEQFAKFRAYTRLRRVIAALEKATRKAASKALWATSGGISWSQFPRCPTLRPLIGIFIENVLPVYEEKKLNLMMKCLLENYPNRFLDGWCGKKV